MARLSSAEAEEIVGTLEAILKHGDEIDSKFLLRIIKAIVQAAGV